jgi:hypothetical protein
MKPWIYQSLFTKFNAKMIQNYFSSIRNTQKEQIYFNKIMLSKPAKNEELKILNEPEPEVPRVEEEKKELPALLIP